MSGNSLTRAAMFAAMLPVTLMCACGGGGGGSGSASGTVSPPTPNLKSAPVGAAMNTFYSTSQAATVSGRDNIGNTYTLQIAFTPNVGTTTFEGVTVNSATQTVTLTKNGVALAPDVETVYYTLNPFMAHGSVRSGGTPYTITSNLVNLPTTANTGDSSFLDSGTTWHDSTKIVLDAQYADAWTVSEDTPSTVLLCVTDTIQNVTAQGTADGLASGQEVDCYHINAAGSATIASVGITIGSTSVTLK